MPNFLVSSYTVPSDHLHTKQRRRDLDNAMQTARTTLATFGLVL
jgi:hypothetical protein